MKEGQVKTWGLLSWQHHVSGRLQGVRRPRHSCTASAYVLGLNLPYANTGLPFYHLVWFNPSETSQEKSLRSHGIVVVVKRSYRTFVLYSIDSSVSIWGWLRWLRYEWIRANHDGYHTTSVAWADGADRECRQGAKVAQRTTTASSPTEHLGKTRTSAFLSLRWAEHEIFPKDFCTDYLLNICCCS